MCESILLQFQESVQFGVLPENMISSRCRSEYSSEEEIQGDLPMTGLDMECCRKWLNGYMMFLTPSKDESANVSHFGFRLVVITQFRILDLVCRYT